MARIGTMTTKTIKSNYVQEELQIKVFSPKHFNSLYPNQVCYMQDGNDYFQMGRIATLSDQLHKEEVLVNTTFVGIHYRDRPDRLKKYHPHGDQFEAYQNFLLQEVVPAVEEMVPLNPLGTFNSLMGDSLAGTFAFVTALKYPKTFGKVVMQSPLVDESVFDMVKQYTRNLTLLEMYHSIGGQETAVRTSLGEELDFVKPNKQLAEMIQKETTNYIYHIINEGNHTWKHWQKEMPDVLENMFS
ncbi:MAG TPA: alpha/beta hydrolase-fold protein [Pseudogracilibacillus sp.]|nr:alpha/beta hydrolase-fold protein [Pseudogracilibacillus sp.]